MLSGNSSGNVRSIDTAKMDEVAKNFQSKITTFSETKNDVYKIISELLLNWSGSGKVEFETQFNLIYGKLGDIEESLTEFYENLIGAEVAYREMDDELSKSIKENSENVNLSVSK